MKNHETLLKPIGGGGATLGFTLAEVLITLGIIGVVAALTMPSLIAQHKNQETVARLQKAISVLNNGMGQMMALEGVDQIEHLELSICEPTVIGNKECTGEYLKKYFQVVKDNIGVSIGTSGKEFYPYDELKTLKGTKNALIGGFMVESYYGFMTGDGILYYPFFFVGVGNALVDINGKKGPNQIGRDIFVLQRNGGTYVPKGGETWDDSSSNDYCNPQSGLGYGCAARIVQDGWKIKY